MSRQINLCRTSHKVSSCGSRLSLCLEMAFVGRGRVGEFVSEWLTLRLNEVCLAPGGRSCVFWNLMANGVSQKDI